jgi:hypothetical protein
MIDFEEAETDRREVCWRFSSADGRDTGGFVAVLKGSRTLILSQLSDRNVSGKDNIPKKTDSWYTPIVD